MNSAIAALRGASPYLLLALAPLFWACNWIVGRALAPEVPPMTMTFLRWLCAFFIVAPFAWRHFVREWPIVRAKWKTMLLLGATGVGTHNALAYLGLNYTTAVNGVILNSFIPVMIIALSWLFMELEGPDADMARRHACQHCAGQNAFAVDLLACRCDREGARCLDAQRVH